MHVSLLVLLVGISNIAARGVTSWADVHTMFTSQCRPFKVVDDEASSLSPVAILLAGSSRTFYESWPSMHRLLFEGNHVDVYATVNLPADPTRNDCWQFVALLATQTTRYLHAEHQSTDSIMQSLKSTSNPSAPYKDRQNGYNAIYYQGVLIEQYWNQKAFNAMQHVEKKRNHTYTTVVRVRPDLLFLDTALRIDLTWAHNTALSRLNGTEIYVMVPNSNKFGGITGAFAIMSRKAADTYHNMLAYIETTQTSNDTTVPFHPETMLHRNMASNNVFILYVENFIHQKNSSDTAKKGSDKEQIKTPLFDYCLRREGKCQLSPRQREIECRLPSEHGSFGPRWQV